ncbi:MAG TPA: hypothetical protein VGD55_05945 [Acidothermaceae bacterium]
MSWIVGLPAASAVVVLEAGALEAAARDGAAWEDPAWDDAAGDAEAVADADAGELAEFEADGETAGLGELPPQATSNIAVRATVNTVRLQTKRSEDIATSKASSKR